MTSLKEAHDRLLAEKPEGDEHDATTCVLCNDEPTVDPTHQGGDMSKTYTEDELNSAVREAVAPIAAELDQMRAERSNGEVEERIAAAKADADAQVAELQTQFDAQVAALQLQLDAAEILANETAAEKDAIVAYLTAEAQQAEMEATVASRTESRVAAVTAVASFTEEQVAKNTARWIAFSDEDFDAYIEDLKAIATPSTAAADLPTGVPAETAMNNTRSKDTESALGAFYGTLKAGIDPRTHYLREG